MTTAHRTSLDTNALVMKLDLKPGMKVGDFGVGGAAFFVSPLATKVGAHGEVLMFDILKTALAAALSTVQLKGYKNCKAVWSNLEIYEGARGIGQGSLDAGVLVNVLHQSKKHREILVEIHRMLKSSAKLLVIDWQPDTKNTIAPPVEQRLAADHVEMLGRSLGFATLEKFSASPDEWGLVLVKT